MNTDTLRAQVFLLPDLGEGLTEAEIVEWKVAVGDTVDVDHIVVEVETAKAAVEVPVPYAGTVLCLHAEAGTALAVGRPLITVGPAGGETGVDPGGVGSGGVDSGAVGSRAGDPRVADPGVASPGALDPGALDPGAADRYREEEQAGSGNVLIGYGTGHAPASRRRRRGSASRPTALPGPRVGDRSAPRRDVRPAGGHAPAPESGRACLVISPLVRRLARDHGIDLTRLTPDGADGIVRRVDVEQAIALDKQASSPAPSEPLGASGVERIPLRGIRRAVAHKLARSRAEIPDATTWVDVDATALLAAKDVLQAAHPEQRIGLLAILTRICVAGLRRFPALNSSVDTAREEIVRFAHVNVGFAAQTERGLVVPVVRNAHTLTTAQLAAELARLTALARTGSLPPEALTGGTFTLNNYGVFGVDGSTPIINHPEAALLGVGRIVDKPWVVDGALAVRKVTQLSLSFDHRVCDGGVAGGFLRYVADCVERPATLLADL
ncbi:dihydrolipoamide acetyltransferase family protein [Embleya sp. NPDC050493]|uniref:dihydrolipoamide acetyltransferase family protein n=1 Tax=Embleya sp. NPDC050493 TaxID=3363989 RepID=UPI003793827F